MNKHQVNIRISKLTRDKLSFLSEYYGTQTEAVAIAIDRLYRETRYGYGDAPIEDRQQGGSSILAEGDLEKIRVLIVDDETHIRGNIEKMLLPQAHIEVVGTAASGAEGIAKGKTLQPHIVLMDRIMPEMDGLIASQEMMMQVPYARVIMTAVYGAESLRRSMLAGARDCLSRPFGVEELLHSIHRVYSLAPYNSSLTTE